MDKPGDVAHETIAVDEAAYAELEKQVADDGESEAAEAEAPAEAAPAKADEAPKDEAEKPEGTGEPKKAPLDYTELEKRHNNLQGALGQERAARKQAAERAQQLETVLRQLVEQNKGQQQEQAPAIPDINEDPVGHFKAQVATLTNELQAIKRQAGETQQQFRARVEEEKFWREAVAAENQFRASTADYDAAVQWYETTRLNELEILLPDGNPHYEQAAAERGFRTLADWRMSLLNEDRVSIAKAAATMGMNPAERYYNVARARGFTGAPKAPAQQAKPTGHVAMAKAGAAAAKTLTGGGGQADGDISMARLAELYLEDGDRADKEFKRMKAKGLLG